jgi:CubicO group peptidase (beta-lactamase class C family)
VGRRSDDPKIDGFVAPGLEGVVVEFERNFTRRGELGAAFAATRDGALVVDLWGGVADSRTGRAWQHDTAQIVFSATKGLTAVCLALLLDRGLLELDAPVARYWPEFAAAGKEELLVRDAVSHSARLPGITSVRLSWQDATDAARMAEILAAEPQSTDPRAANTYHALTYGWICGELVRRIDGRRIGCFFRDEIAQPLGLELWMGLPRELEPRVARVELSPIWNDSPLFTQAEIDQDPLLFAVFGNPVRYDPNSSFPWNERLWHAAEVPAANAIGTARSIASLYGNLDNLLSREALELIRRPLSVRKDTLVGSQMSFGVGFQLQTEDLPLGPPLEAFGHGGFGGSRHGRWPEQRVGFSYAMNLMRQDIDDVRAKSLLDALYASLE